MTDYEVSVVDPLWTMGGLSVRKRRMWGLGVLDMDKRCEVGGGVLRG